MKTHEQVMDLRPANLFIIEIFCQKKLQTTVCSVCTCAQIGINSNFLYVEANLKQIWRSYGVRYLENV